MSIVLGLDVETTGLLPETDRITEIGAVLLDWNTGTPLEIMSRLVFPEIPIPAEVVKLNGITEAMIEEHGILEEDALMELGCMMDKVEYVMAHNAAFDRGFIHAAFVRRGLVDPEKPWLCSRMDIKYDEAINTRHLTYLAAEHGFCNPFQHRAIFDVLTMLKVAESYDFDAIVARSLEPIVIVQALVSFDEKEFAKARGYQWFAPKKQWWKSAKQSDYLAEKDVCGFRTVLLDAAPE